MTVKKRTPKTTINLSEQTYNVGKALELLIVPSKGAKRIANLFAAQVLLFEETKRLEPSQKEREKKARGAKILKHKQEQAKKKIAKTNEAFMKKLQPSPELAAVVGTPRLARVTAVSIIWNYVKRNNLQNPKDKRNVICDDKLKNIFGKDEVTLFEIAPLIKKHLSK